MAAVAVVHADGCHAFRYVKIKSIIIKTNVLAKFPLIISKLLLKYPIGESPFSNVNT